NPHASDGGLFGIEEREQIIPAIADARAKGIDVEGPHPPDTFFAKAVAGAYDICVAMYHDQGHIPVKIKGFHFDPQTKKWNDVRASLANLEPSHFDLIYKKIDSALRGPVLAEVQASMNQRRLDTALLLPQNPSRGRTIESGQYLINGVPIDQTDFARDPDHP